MSVTDSLNSESEDVVGGSLVIVCMTSSVKMTKQLFFWENGEICKNEAKFFLRIPKQCY